MELRPDGTLLCQFRPPRDLKAAQVEAVALLRTKEGLVFGAPTKQIFTYLPPYAEGIVQLLAGFGSLCLCRGLQPAWLCFQSLARGEVLALYTSMQPFLAAKELICHTPG